MYSVDEELMTEAVTLPRIEENNTVKRKVSDLLSEALLSGKLKPGQRLNESQLARQLGTSRSPVRESLQQLQEQGFVLNIPRRGMFVVKLDDVAIQKINSFRLILEAEALRLARANCTPEAEKRLEGIISRMARVTPVSEGASLDFEFHRAIWKMTRNEFLERSLISATAPLFAHGVLDKVQSDQHTWKTDSHLGLLEFIRGNSRESAEEVMLTHLRRRYHQPEKFSSIGLPTTIHRTGAKTGRK